MSLLSSFAASLFVLHFLLAEIFAVSVFIGRCSSTVCHVSGGNTVLDNAGILGDRSRVEDGRAAHLKFEFFISCVLQNVGNLGIVPRRVHELGRITVKPFGQRD